MNLFDFLPAKFFSILSSSNKDIYADCIFVIYKTSSNISYGVKRELIIDVLTDYFNDSSNVTFMDEKEVISDARDKASFIIRKFEECGWIYRVDDNNYVEEINFHDYAIAFIETIEKLINNDRLEYQGYVYSIYSLLFNNEDKMLPSIMLEQVFDNIKKLINGLKILNSNIHQYIDKITKLKTAEEIMDLHFNDYEANIVDKSYHRLKTSDNVSKFRPKIISKLESIRDDKELIKVICNQYVELEKVSSVEQGYDIIIRNLSDMINAFNNIDTIIRDIDHKHNVYLRQSLVRVKFMLNTTTDLTGQINSVLKYIVSNAKQKALDYNNDYLPEDLNIFEIFPQSFIDEFSLYTATEGKREFNPQKLNKTKVLSNEERKKYLIDFKKKSELRLNKKVINEYVLKQLDNRKVMNASMLPLNTMNDFIKLMYIFVYSKSHLVSYHILRKNKIFNYNGYRFNDFEIWRK